MGLAHDFPQNLFLWKSQQLILVHYVSHLSEHELPTSILWTLVRTVPYNQYITNNRYNNQGLIYTEIIDCLVPPMDVPWHQYIGVVLMIGMCLVVACPLRLVRTVPQGVLWHHRLSISLIAGGSPYMNIALADLYTALASGYRMERPNNCSPEV